MGLTDRVMQYWNSQTFIGKKVKVVTGTSSADQEYAILVTSGVWYACRVFVADMSPQVPTWPFGTAAEILWWKLTGQDRPLPVRPPVYDLIINTHCFTMNGVDKFIDEMQTLFDKPSMDELKKYLPDYLEVREVPSDWGNNPDKYLKRFHTCPAMDREKQQQNVELATWLVTLFTRKPMLFDWG